MTVELTEYGYNSKVARFVNLRTGRYVKPDEVYQVLDTTINQGFARLEQFAAAVARGERGVDELQNALISHLESAHSAMYTLGRGGVYQLEQADYQIMSKRLESEYAYAENFMADIENGNLTEGQIRARLGLYQEHIWASYHDGLTEGAATAGFDEERRVLNAAAEHCEDCIQYERQGWQPIGTLPKPGDQSECGARCRCQMEFRKSGKRNRRTQANKLRR